MNILSGLILRQLPNPIFNETAIIVVNFIAATLILTVFTHHKLNQRKSQVFLLMGIAILFWVDFAYLARVFGRMYDLSVLFLRIAWCATPFVFFFTYINSTLFVNKADENKLVSKVLFVLALLLGLITLFTNLTITGEKFTNGILDIKYGIAFYPYLGLVLSMIIFTFVPLIKTKLETAVKVFLLGLIIFYAANMIFNITLPVFFHITHLYFLGDYSTIILLGFTMYAIYRHSLLNIKILATEVFTLFICTILFTIIFFSPNFTDSIFYLFVFLLSTGFVL